MRILVIRFSSMGDIILTSSVLAWIKSYASNSTIDFATSKEFHVLLKDNPLIHKVLLFDRGMKNKVRELISFSKKINKENYDLVIDLHGTLRATIFRLLSFKTPFLVLNKRRVLRFMFVRFKINLMNHEPHLKRVLRDFGETIGFKGDFKVIEDFLNNLAIDSKPYLSSISLTFKKLENKKQKTIIIAPIASFEAKRWEIQNYYRLIELILEDETFKDVEVLSLGGPRDLYCEILNPLSKKFSRFKNLQGQTSLLETITLVKGASFCIGNDTGIPHIAEAFGIPVLVLFGPTVPEFGFAPHLKNSAYLESHSPYRPTSNTGSRPSKKGQANCMDGITSELVFKQFKSMWEKLG